MIIAGNGGHAIEILNEIEYLYEELLFFDNINSWDAKRFDKYEVINDILNFSNGNSFQYCLGVGNPKARQTLDTILKESGGKIESVISRNAIIGRHNKLGNGINIMSGAVLTNNIEIKYGALIHIHCSIHHDSIIGMFSEISPGTTILGKVTIGDFVSIGSNATILQGVTIGDNAIIGAGAVVTKNIPPDSKAVGVPAKLILQ